MYAIVDIETTGGSPQHEKITEIAIFLHDGTRVVDEFSTLVNPEKSIPSFITGLTGITNEMVAQSPKFYEVARRIVELTDGATFVAHNANFDYSFVRNEFKRLGYDYQRPMLCTVNLSRKLIPARKSYSLGNLCKELGITISDRHRAAGDALATVRLFELLMELSDNQPAANEREKLNHKRGLHPKLELEKIKDLPETAGVYYFHNDRGDIIYIGKSINIRERVQSHFTANGTRKALELKANVTDISVEPTGSELVALLLESAEIKRHKPLYNRLQRRSVYQFGLYSYFDNAGYMCFSIGQTSQFPDVPLTTFESKKGAEKLLSEWCHKFNLCMKLCGLYPSSGACFYHALGECRGACTGAEPPEKYNMRAMKLYRYFNFDTPSFYVLDNGRHHDEKAIVKVENGKYIGYGYIDNGLLGQPGWYHYISVKPMTDNRDVHQIIASYIRRNPQLVVPAKSGRVFSAQAYQS